MDLELDDRVRRRAGEVLGAGGPAWCERALGAARSVVERLGLTGATAVGGGRLSALWRARAHGEAVAVKVPMVDTESHLAAARALGESGCGPAVRWTGDAVVVCEWIDGGPVPDTPAALHRIADLAEALDDVPAPGALVAADDWLRDRLVGDPADVAVGSVRPSAVQRTVALRELDELGRRWSFCHGDLHAGNVVWRPEGYPVLIDPRGVTGEAELDCANLALKSRPGAPVGVAESLAASLAGTLGRDRERSVAWVRVLRAARV